MDRSSPDHCARESGGNDSAQLQAAYGFDRKEGRGNASLAETQAGSPRHDKIGNIKKDKAALRYRNIAGSLFLCWKGNRGNKLRNFIF